MHLHTGGVEADGMEDPAPEKHEVPRGDVAGVDRVAKKRLALARGEDVGDDLLIPPGPGAVAHRVEERLASGQEVREDVRHLALEPVVTAVGARSASADQMSPCGPL